MNQLAGVSVYPIPNNGDFFVSVPVEAMVKIYSVNGTRINAMMVNAEVQAISLQQSGIYIIRVSANG